MPKYKFPPAITRVSIYKIIFDRNMKEKTNADKLTIVLLVIYLIVLGWILLFKMGVQFSYMGERRVNLVPFKEPLIRNGKIHFGENLLNMVIFMPLGMYAGVLFRRWTFGRKVFFFFLTSFTIESLQFILRVGAFDVTDIITNVLGGIVGLMIYHAIERLFNDPVKCQKFINIFSTISTVLILSLLLLLKLKMLPIRYQ
jgi:glycopeptide antibiotics resistance protein